MKKRKSKINFELSEIGMMTTCILLFLQFLEVFTPSIFLTLTPLFLAYFIQYILMLVQFYKWDKLRRRREDDARRNER